MRGWYHIVLLAGMLLLAPMVRADDPPKAERSPEAFNPTDSIAVTDSLQQARTERLYDSIRVKTERRAVTRALYKTLFRRSRHRDTTTVAQIINEESLLKPYEGRRIGRISIERLHPFDKDGNWLERTANNLHTLTRGSILRRDLLFREGDLLDAHTIARNKQLLQDRPYISEVVIRVEPDSIDTTLVNLILRTRDSWTIDVDASVHSGDEFSFGLSEANLFGRGHNLRLETNLNYRNFDYGGNVVEYNIPNIRGSFFSFDLEAGRAFNTSRLKVAVEKPFLRTTDYEVGALYHNDKREHYYITRDTTELIRERAWEVWGGYAHYLPSIRSSLFLTGRALQRRYTIRPDDTSADRHPALHDREAALVEMGLYREHYYSANKIYGYGRREYISSGYLASLTAGYEWGEWQDALYLGTTFRAGDFTDVGYLMGELSAGGFLEQGSGFRRSALKAELRWFSNLYAFRRTNVRQFFTLHYTQGWNRLEGADEVIHFTKRRGLNAFKEKVWGTSRLFFNGETVFFTPYEPLGFRLALFTFLDGGLIGMSDNPFRNDPFCSFGVGVRVRNERLVFRTVQIRLGVAFGRHGWVDSRYFHLSSEPALSQYRYDPTRPEFLLFD